MDGAQAIHNLAGMAEYLGGALALCLAGSAFSRAGRGPLSTTFWLAGAGVFFCLLCIAQPQFEFRGAAQRVAETLLFGFLVFLAWRPSNSIQ
jgi:hypothetical protein